MPSPECPRSKLHRCWFGAAIFLLGVVALARTEHFYGALLHGWDAQFYYALAHSLVFDGDADLSNDLELTPYPRPFDRDANGSFEAVPRDQHGKILSHYPAGLSLLEVPLLALGRVARWGVCGVGICSARPIGYSEVEIWCVALGLLAVFAAGMQLLYELVRPHVPSPWRQLALLAAWLGTSLFYYSAVFPFMTHALGFTLAVSTVSIADAILAGRFRWWLLLGAALGALFLVRPQQLTMALPLALMLAPVLRRPPHLWLGWAAAGLLTLFGLMALQAWVYSHTMGVWTVNAYAVASGRFDWWRPAPSMVLLNPMRGLVWVSPIVLPAALGFVTSPPRSIPRCFAAFAVQAVIQIYLIACWVPGQADTFGARMWSECAPAVACGLGLLYLHVSRTRRLALTMMVVACVIWTNRLLWLYMMGRLRPEMSHLTCLRMALGL